MALDSIFGSRRALRPTQATLAQAQVFREVRTEDELRQALQPLGSAFVNDGFPVVNSGRRIVITAPIALKSPIIIDASLPGTVIESHGRLPITCLVDDIECFIVNAAGCVLRDLLILSGDTGSFQFGVVVNAGPLWINDVVALTKRGFISGSAGVGDVKVRGCYAARSGSSTYTGIVYNGQRWHIGANTLEGAGGAVAVRAGASGGFSSIVANSLGGDGITTNAGVGSNTISANTDTGAIIAAGTDNTTGGNT